MGIVTDVDEQEAILLSYHSARAIRHKCWWYRVLQAEKEAIYAKIDEAADEVYNRDDEAGTSAPATDSEE